MSANRKPQIGIVNLYPNTKETSGLTTLKYINREIVWSRYGVDSKGNYSFNLIHHDDRIDVLDFIRGCNPFTLNVDKSYRLSHIILKVCTDNIVNSFDGTSGEINTEIRDKFLTLYKSILQTLDEIHELDCPQNRILVVFEKDLQSESPDGWMDRLENLFSDSSNTTETRRKLRYFLQGAVGHTVPQNFMHLSVPNCDKEYEWFYVHATTQMNSLS